MRYLPLREEERRAMCARIGVDSIEDLFAGLPTKGDFSALPPHRSEQDVERHMSALAEQNLVSASLFIGAGAYRHHVPATVDALIQRSEFLTTYTPYQPEIAQGTLQYLFEFQTQVAILTGMEIANASMYDGSTACAEAVFMAHRLTGRRRAVLSTGLHPHYKAVVETQSRFAGYEVSTTPDPLKNLAEDVSCVVVQNPAFCGDLVDMSALAAAAHKKGILVIGVVTEVVSLGAIQPPGAMGADIVAAEGQSIGNGLNFGGPFVGLLACRKKFARHMPGRLCGETVDEEGRRGFVLTLATREQHIRRERATSNICTNSGLCALAFTIHMALLGGSGLKRLAHLNHARAVALAERLSDLKGVDVITPTFFNEFTIRTPVPAARLISRLAERGILGGVPLSRLSPEGDDSLIIVAATEMNSLEQCDTYAKTLKALLP